MIYKYADIRPRIKSGDVLFFSGTTLKARLVKWWTKSHYSHAGIAWVTDGRVFVLEAVLNGVRIYPLSLETRFNWASSPLAWSDGAAEYALRKVGKPYSQFLAALAGLGYKMRRDDKWYQCSEYALDILERCIGIDSVKSGLYRTPDTPQGVANWLISNRVAILEIKNEGNE